MDISESTFPTDLNFYSTVSKCECHNKDNHWGDHHTYDKLCGITYFIDCIYQSNNVTHRQNIENFQKHCLGDNYFDYINKIIQNIDDMYIEGWYGNNYLIALSEYTEPIIKCYYKLAVLLYEQFCTHKITFEGEFIHNNNIYIFIKYDDISDIYLYIINTEDYTIISDANASVIDILMDIE